MYTFDHRKNDFAFDFYHRLADFSFVLRNNGVNYYFSFQPVQTTHDVGTYFLALRVMTKSKQ